jgi:hypothetical protein
VINDFQLTHINCAYPWRSGILVSTLIQGAIGWFDEHGQYQELLRGLVGCHGVRIDQRNSRMFFCDSCLGTVVFLSSDYRIEHRVSTGSVWLHDAEQVSPDVFALSVADRNQIEIIEFSSRKVLTIAPCGDFGNSTQLISYGS